MEYTKVGERKMAYGFSFTTAVFAESVKNSVEISIKKAFDNLTDDEVEKLIVKNSDGSTQEMRLARTLFLAVADQISANFEVEAVRADVKKVKRILKRRK